MNICVLTPLRAPLSDAIVSFAASRENDAIKLANLTIVQMITFRYIFILILVVDP